MDVRFDEGLFVAIAMLLSFNGFSFEFLVGVFLVFLVFWVVCFLTLSLPVEFKVNVPSDSCDWQIGIGAFHNLSFDVKVIYTRQLWVQMEVLCHFFISQLG